MQLRIITYNIHGGIGLDRRFQPDRIGAILKDHAADIVLLQESDKGASRSRYMDMAKYFAEQLDYPYHESGYNVNLSEGCYGNATLSKYPITLARNIDLTIGDHRGRGCQYTSIQIDDQNHNHYSLQVFNLHLGLSPLERQKQAGLLMRSREFSCIDDTSLCIVGGDFNDWLSRLRALFVEGMSLNCATDRDTRYRTKPIKTYPSFAPRGGLDRIYYRGRMKLINAIRCRHRTVQVASDHLPVIADFELV